MKLAYLLDNHSLNSSKTQLTQKAYGYYRNYDFLDDDEETRVTHIISITAKNDGTYSYVVDWVRWGESLGNIRLRYRNELKITENQVHSSGITDSFMKKERH